MRRDPDLIRSILLVVEHQQGPISTDRLKIDAVAPVVVQYHANLLLRADFIDAKVLSHLAKFELLIVGLTARGHDFVEAVQDDRTWDAIRYELRMAEQSVPFSVIEAYALHRARLAAGLPVQPDTAVVLGSEVNQKTEEEPIHS